jgi:glycosyltransferase involved in cell wall biosynthesis
LRIAVWHNLPSGGAKRALYDHVHGLVARGHHVESWCPPTADQNFLPIGDLVLEHIVPLDTIEQLGWKAPLARISGGGSLIPAALKAMDDHSQRCAEEIDRGAFDVVFAGSSLLFAVTGLARHVRGPSLLYLQEPWRPLYEARPRLPWPARANSEGFHLSAIRDRLYDAISVRGLRIQAREELAGVRAYDRVLANSYFSRESMLRAYGIDATVCYLGVDTERYKDMGLARQKLVAGIGRFSPHKRVEVIIEAVAQVRSPRPALAWIGDAADPRYLRQLVELAERRGVAFTTYLGVSHPEVVRVLNEAAVMAYAPRLEPFGYPPLEAAACGLPVVARAEGGVRETVIGGETGLLVDDDNELHVALERILDDDGLARRMGAAARRRAESTWSLSAATDRLESHLVDLVEGKGASEGADLEP